MKDLTLGRLAGAGLRANRRAYRSLAAGIFLSIFLVSFVCLCVHGAALSLREKQTDRLGAEDAILFDCPVADEDLRASGWFDTVAHAGVTGTLAEGAKALGWYDADAAALLRRRVLAGRLPERPGELAAEESALEALDIRAELGDALELTVTPVDGAPETRSYTLVGLLPEQASLLDLSGRLLTSSGEGGLAVLQLPACVVSAEEAPFATGRLALHRLLTLKPGRSARALLRSVDEILTGENALYDAQLVGVARYEGTILDRWSGDQDTPFFSTTVICILWLGASLVVAACVGVAGAMESRLAARVEEIGMLRAVGATKRQIRRIFGREAWVLAAATAPAALAAACLCAFLAARFFPAMLVFRPAPALLLPIFLFSVATILLAARLPLRRAANTMPMQVLRDARLIRKMRGRASRLSFEPARLIALRQTLLHPGRLVGPGLLVGVMVFIVFLASTGVWAILPRERPAGFYLQGESLWSGPYYSVTPDPVLSEGDLAQLRALPGVKRVQAGYSVDVDLLLDPAGGYSADASLQLSGIAGYFSDYDGLRASWSSASDVLQMENGWPGDDVDEPLRADARAQWAVQQTLGTEKKVLEINVQIVDELPDSWREAVTGGRVDVSALDSGQEVLVYAPDIYVRADADGTVVTAPYPVDIRYALVRKNDYFFTGQTLAFSQLLTRDRGDMLLGLEGTPQAYLDFYAALERHDASARVGAVLQGRADGLWSYCLITTEKGARAMGLDLSAVNYLTVELRSAPTPEEEEALERRVTGIAARGGMSVRNLMAAYRKRLEENRMAFATLTAASLVFLAAAVGLVSGGVRRRIAADTRAIGTLRAVGAGERVLRRCYGGQVAVSLALGALLGAIPSLALALSGMIGTERTWPVALAAMGVFLVCAWAACAVLLRRSLNALLRRSIIENIREL